MANTLNDLSDGDITRECLAEFHNSLTFLKTINNQYDSRFAISGAKNGGTLLIRNPNEYTVRTGKVRDVPDADETYQTLTVATQKGVDLPSFSSLEQTMQVDDFRKRYLKPAMSRLAADVESTIITAAYKDVFNMTGVPATTPATLSSVRDAGARLTQELAPSEGRSICLDAAATAAVCGSMDTYFHKGKEIEKSFTEGYIGRAAGMNWYETEMVPSHTNGTRTDATPVTDTSAITNGDTTLTTTGQTSSQTLKDGDVFTIEGVYSVNRETKVRQAHLQQFVITADLTADATDVFAISPALNISGARQNVEVVSGGAGKAIVHVASGGSGDASAVYAQNLAYHRDFCTFVTADLHIEPGQRMNREVIEGVSMRVWQGSDFNNDEFGTRVDVLFGSLVMRPEWAVRVRG